MVLDTSAILAILQDEPERRKFNEAIEAAESRSLSTASFVECSIILESRYGADGIRDLDLFIAKAQVSLVAVDEEQADLARRAFRKYGTGGVTRPASTSETAFPTPWRRRLTSLFCLKGTTSRRLMFSAIKPAVSHCKPKRRYMRT